MLEPEKILPQFLNDLTLLVKRILVESDVEPNSDLIKSVSWISNDNGISLLANDYFTYVSTGRRPKAKKVPIQDLIEWVKFYKIGSGDVNNTAWAIQQGIYKNGIKGKNYFETTVDLITEMSTEELAEVLSEDLADEIQKSFKPLIKQ